MSHTSGLIREGLWKIKIVTEVAHVTLDSDTTFKVKGQLVADVLIANMPEQAPPGE